MDRPGTSALRWAAIILAFAAGLMFAPLWPSVILATWFAVFARPLLATVNRVIRGWHRAAAALTILLLLVVLLPLGLFLVSLSSAALDLVRSIARSKGGRSALEALVSSSGAGDGLQRLGASELLMLVRQYGERAWDVAVKVLGITAQGLIGLFVFVLASYTLLAEGDRAYRWLELHAPIEPRHLRRFAAAFVETGRGLFVGVGLTALIQGLTASIAYLVLGIPRAFVLGVLTAFASLIPSVGTALVWVPAAIGLALTGRWIAAIVLLAIRVVGHRPGRQPAPSAALPLRPHPAPDVRPLHLHVRRARHLRRLGAAARPAARPAGRRGGGHSS